MYTGQHGRRTWRLCKWCCFSRVWFSDYILNLPGVGTRTFVDMLHGCPTTWDGKEIRWESMSASNKIWERPLPCFPKGKPTLSGLKMPVSLKLSKKEMNTKHIISTVSMLYLMTYHLGKFLIAPQTDNLTCFSLGFGNQPPSPRKIGQPRKALGIIIVSSIMVFATSCVGLLSNNQK